MVSPSYSSAGLRAPGREALAEAKLGHIRTIERNGSTSRLGTVFCMHQGIGNMHRSERTKALIRAGGWAMMEGPVSAMRISTPISYLACTDRHGAFVRCAVTDDITKSMGSVDENVEEHLIECAWHTGHERQVRSEIRHHLRHILPLIARHSDGALDGLVEIDTDLFLCARMRKLFHGADDGGDAFYTLKGLLDSRGDFRSEIGNINGSGRCFYMAQHRGHWRAVSTHLIQGRIVFQERAEVLERLLEEEHIIPDVLNGRVDFVRDTGSQQPNGFELL